MSEPESETCPCCGDAGHWQETAVEAQPMTLAGVRMAPLSAWQLILLHFALTPEEQQAFLGFIQEYRGSGGAVVDEMGVEVLGPLYYQWRIACEREVVLG